VADDLGRTRDGSSAGARTEQRLREGRRESNSHCSRNMYAEREKTKIKHKQIKKDKIYFFFFIDQFL
jgi:hypothetical protein